MVTVTAMVILSSDLPTRTATAAALGIVTDGVAHAAQGVAGGTGEVSGSDLDVADGLSVVEQAGDLGSSDLCLDVLQLLALALFSAMTASARAGRAATLFAFRVLATVCSITCLPIGTNQQIAAGDSLDTADAGSNRGLADDLEAAI